MPESRGVRRAFICSGGGLRGCFQVGAIDYLVREAGIVPDVVCGISTGSLQALGLTVGGKQDRTKLLRDVWAGLRRKSDVYTTPVLPLLGSVPALLADALRAAVTHTEMNGSWDRGIHRLSGLRRIVTGAFDAEAIRSSDIRLVVGAVDLVTSRLSYFDSRFDPREKPHADYERRPLDSAELVIASCSIPAFFPPVPYGKEELVDGGVRDIAPLSVAIHTLKDMASTVGDTAPRLELYVMLCDPLGAPKVLERRNLLSVLLRTIDVMCNEIMNDDLETVLKINADLERQGGVASRFRHVHVFIIHPDHEVIGVLEVDQAKIQAGMRHGRERAALATGVPARLDAAGRIVTSA